MEKVKELDLESQVTRRRVVTTGGKLVYAAPLVVATMKLTGGSAAAISPRIVPGDFEGLFQVSASAGGGECLTDDNGQPVVLDPNDTITIVAGGRVDLNITNGQGLRNVDTVNANGFNSAGGSTNTCPVAVVGDPGFNRCGALLAQIGGQVYFVGEGERTITGATGAVCLVINDTSYNNNVNAFTGAFEGEYVAG